MKNTKEKRGVVTPRRNFKYEVLDAPDSAADGALEIHIDYFRGQFDGRSEDFRRALILKLIGTEPAKVIRNSKFTAYEGDRGYTEKIVGANGQTLYWRKADKGVDIRVELPGTYFATSVTLSGFARQLIAWQNMGIRVTRIDYALTDKNKYLKWEDMINAVEIGDYSGFKSSNVYTNFSSGRLTGATINLGSRRSDRFVRIYETSTKHEFKANRIEVEFKGDLCRKVVRELTRNWLNFKHRHQFNQDWNIQDSTADQRLQEYAARVVCGSIDFISRDSVPGNGSTAQCPQLVWWKDFIDSVGGQCRLFVERVKPSIAKTANWIERQVSKSLALFQIGLGAEEFNAWMQRTLQKGQRKVKPTDSLTLGVLFDKGAAALDDLHDYSSA